MQTQCIKIENRCNNEALADIFLFVTFFIEKILKEGYNIVAKRKIIPGYKNSDLSRSKEEAEKLNSNSKMMFLNKSNIVKKSVLCFNSCFA